MAQEKALERIQAGKTCASPRGFYDGAEGLRDGRPCSMVPMMHVKLSNSGFASQLDKLPMMERERGLPRCRAQSKRLPDR